MRIPPAPHRWRVTPRQAVAIQNRLAGQVRATGPRRDIHLVAGTDLAFSADGLRCYAAAVLWDVLSGEVVEQRTVVRAVSFPYVPGLLSFREVPAILAALRRLRTVPEAIMCDGQGLAHPRRFGLACHVGLLTDLPTVGCAKSRLVGEHEEPGVDRGAAVPLVDRGETVGLVLRTRSGVRPVYVSVGHRISLAAAAALVLAGARQFRLPEPTRLADRLVAETKRRAVGSSPTGR